MTERKRVKAEAVEAEAVKVGDTIELDGSGLAVLPDGTVVTCRGTYRVQHAGRHVICGVEYEATDPRKTDAADQADAEV